MIKVSATVLAAFTVATAVQGFVPPPSRPFVAATTTTSCAAPTTTTTTSLNAAVDNESLLLMKQGLKWVLVPNDRQQIDGLFGTSQVLAVAPNPAWAKREAAAAAARAKAAAVVEPTMNSAVAPMETTVTPPPVVEAVTTMDAAAAAATTLPSASLPDVVSIPDATPVIPMDTPVVVEILPNTAAMNTPVAAASNTVDFEQLLSAIRENHWASLPRLSDRAAGTVSGKAPMLIDILKEKEEATEAFVRANGPSVAAAFQERVETSARIMQENGYIIQQKVSLLMDPAMYQQLKLDMAASNSGIDLEQLGKYFKLGDSFYMPALAQLQGIVNMDQVGAATASWADFTMSIQALKELVQQKGGSYNYEDLLAAMNLDKTSGWYVGTATVVFLLALSVATAISNTKAAASNKIILTDAAMSIPPTPVPAEPKADEVRDAARALVEAEMAQLKNATAAVYKQLAELKAEKNLRAYEVATMKSELRTVMNMLDANIVEEKQLRLALEKTQERLSQETAYLRKQLDERAAAEKQLRDQLAATQDMLAKEMAKVERAKVKAEIEVKAAEIEVDKLLKEKMQMEKEMENLRQEMENLRKQLPVDKEEPTPVLKATGSNNSATAAAAAAETNRVNGSTPATDAAAATTAATVLAQTKQRLPTTSYTDLSNAYFAAISEPNVRGVKATADAAGNKRMVKRLVKRLVSKSTTSQSPPLPQQQRHSEDWSHLSMTALRRKTVKELTTYLEAKGATTTGPDGKTLKKDALVQTVLSQ